MHSADAAQTVTEVDLAHLSSKLRVPVDTQERWIQADMDTFPHTECGLENDCIMTPASYFNENFLCAVDYTPRTQLMFVGTFNLIGVYRILSGGALFSSKKLTVPIVPRPAKMS